MKLVHFAVSLLLAWWVLLSSHYRTFTYYGSLINEKLLKIFFWGQIGSSQEAEVGECNFDSFCLAHLRGNFLREHDVNLGPLFSCQMAEPA